MNPKNKRTLFLTSTICIILSIVAFALSHMGGASNENYILLYVIAVLLNIVLNLALSIKIASTNGAKALVSLGKWIMPIAGVVYLIPQVYSVLFPAKTMQVRKIGLPKHLIQTLNTSWAARRSLTVRIQLCDIKNVDNNIIH